MSNSVLPCGQQPTKLLCPQDDTIPILKRKERGTKEPLEEKSEKACLKLNNNNKKPRIMASSPITSWQIEGEKMDTVTDFLFLGSKITADGNCSLGIRRRLLLSRKALTNLDSVLKNKDMALLTQVCIARLWSFMYGFENWTIKKAEHWRIDAFELWCWRRLLRVPWTGRRSKQPIFKEIKPEYSWTDAEAEASLLWPPDAKS